MSQNQSSQRIPLILGSTGKTGKRVIARFEAAGLPYRPASRHTAIPFDWFDQNTWEPVLEGINRAYVVFYPDLSIPQAKPILQAFIDLAKVKGVEQLVLLSGRGEPAAQDCEVLVQNSGLAWTVVRASWFNQNFSESFFQESLIQGELFLPLGETKEPFVDLEDLADVVFAALQDPAAHQHVYDITGPELLSMPEVVAIIAQASGRPLKYQQVSLEDYLQGMEQAGVEPDMLQTLAYLFTETFDGHNAYLSDGIQKALKREPRRFSEYAREAHQQGAWEPEHAAVL